MKKILLALLTSLACCLCMAGCGGDGGDTEPAADAGEKTEKVQATTIVGDWECVDMTLSDSGQEMNKEDLEELYSVDISEMAAMTAAEDGTGEFTFMDISGPITWTESDGGYDIIQDGQDEDAAPMHGELKDGALVITMESSYTSDGAEMKSSIVITFESKGE